VAAADEGVMANVQLAHFERRCLGGLLARVPAAGAAPAAPPARRRRRAGAQGYLPTVLALRARELQAEAARCTTWWSAARATAASGAPTSTPTNSMATSNTGSRRRRRRPLYARLARLSIARLAASESRRCWTAAEQHPGAGRRGRRLRAARAASSAAGDRRRQPRRRHGGARRRLREWRLNKLSLTMPEATSPPRQLGGARRAAARRARRGRPRPASAPHVDEVPLDIADAGALLARFGMKDVVRRGRGAMEGNVAWIGSPLRWTTRR
jgi:hypothetical protein